MAGVHLNIYQQAWILPMLSDVSDSSAVRFEGDPQRIDYPKGTSIPIYRNTFSAKSRKCKDEQLDVSNQGNGHTQKKCKTTKVYLLICKKHAQRSRTHILRRQL